MRAAISVVGVVLMSVTVGASAAPRQAPPAAAPAISGPSVVTFGQTASYGVNYPGAVARHQWDLDGSGAFATDTGPKRAVQASFKRPGTFVVRVRAEGQPELTKEVTVRRPTLAGLEYSPALPQPGQAVSFRLATRSEQGFDPVYYSWKLKGLKPRKTSLTLKRPVPRTAALRAVQGASFKNYRVELAGGAEPTATPNLSRSFPKAGIYRVEVSMIGADGVQTTTEADIKVGSGRDVSQFITGPRPSVQPRPCSVQGGTHCGAITVESNPGGQGSPITFSNATPDFNWCIEVPIIKGNATNVGRVKLARVFAKLDLGYPPAEQFFEENAFDQSAIANGTQQFGGRRARAAQFNTEYETVCKRFGSQAVSWDFGDGTKLTSSGPNGTVEPVVAHTYAQKGNKAVKLVARRFYFDLSKFPNPNTQKEAFAEAAREAFHSTEAELIEQGILKSYLVITGITMVVLEQDCDGLNVRGGIPVRAYTVPGANQDNPLGGQMEDSCFLALDDASTLWRPLPGAQVSLNGIKVTPPAGDTVVVDTRNNRLNALNGGNLSMTFIDINPYGFPDFYPAGQTPQIDVPPAASNAELGGRIVSTLPDYGGGLGQSSFYGFEVASTRIMLAPDSSAIARVSFKEREPLNGATPVVQLGGETVRARAASHSTPDFSMNLDDIRIGPFLTKEFSLNHYPGEGWQGGGQFILDLGGASYELNARYLDDADNTASRCRDLGDNAGPSGLSMGDDGSFRFAGGAVRGSLAVIGPVEINCFGASFRKKPFTLVGLVGGNIPPSTNLIGVDVCVLVAVLKDEESTAGCRTSYKAKNGNEVWVAGRGTITLLDELELGTGGFDVHAGGEILKTTGFGRVYLDVGPFYVDGRVTGTVVLKPTEGFEFTGDIRFGAGPVEVGVKGIVSSKGIGACADLFILSGGFVYRWGGDLRVFAGCSWSEFNSIRVTRRMVQRTDLRAPIGGEPIARTSAADISVDAGRPVSFQVEGVDGPPAVTVTTPSGARITAPKPDARRPYQRVGNCSGQELKPGCVGFLTIAKPSSPVRGRQRLGGNVPPQTIVTIPSPAAGKYTIDTQSGSPAIATVRSSVKLGTRRVTGRIVGTGANRQLQYFVSPIPGQSVEFVEEGDAVGRKLGSVEAGKGGSGRLRFPSEIGLGGPRKVFAIISQDGVPVDRLQVGAYTAPPPPRIGSPRGLKTTRSRSGQLRVCWQGVAQARNYEVRVVASDGRKLLASTPARCATFGGFDESVGASVSVVAVAAWGASPTPARSTVAKKPLPQATIRM